MSVLVTPVRNNEEAKELIHRLLLTAQKMRSNTRELLEGIANDPDIATLVGQELSPNLMGAPGRLDLVDMLLHLDDAEIIEPGAVMNALMMAHKEPTVPVGYLLLWREDLPEPMDAMKQYMKGMAK